MTVRRASIGFLVSAIAFALGLAMMAAGCTGSGIRIPAILEAACKADPSLPGCPSIDQPPPTTTTTTITTTQPPAPPSPAPACTIVWTGGHCKAEAQELYVGEWRDTLRKVKADRPDLFRPDPSRPPGERLIVTDVNGFFAAAVKAAQDLHLCAGTDNIQVWLRPGPSGDIDSWDPVAQPAGATDAYLVEYPFGLKGPCTPAGTGPPPVNPPPIPSPTPGPTPSPTPSPGVACPLKVTAEHPMNAKLAVRRGGAGKVWLDVTFEYFYGVDPITGKNAGPCGDPKTGQPRRWCDIGVDGGEVGVACEQALVGIPIWTGPVEAGHVDGSGKPNPFLADVTGAGTVVVCAQKTPNVCSRLVLQ